MNSNQLRDIRLRLTKILEDNMHLIAEITRLSSENKALAAQVEALTEQVNRKETKNVKRK